MKNNIDLNDVVSTDTLRLAQKFLAFEEGNFGAQAKFLGLDPKKDFQHADLRGVDFSDTNLGGFNFRGADLRGATGVNVKWDATTILDGAETADSLFSFEQARRKIFAEKPKLAEQVQRLKDNHWTNAILGVADLLDSRKVDADSLWVAKTLFEERDELSVRSNILFFMAPVVDDPEEHKGFIYNIFARHSHQPNIVKSALRTLSALYSGDMGAVNVLASYLDHSDIEVRDTALRGILSSPFFMQVRDRILKFMIASGDADLRRTFVARAARHMGPTYVQACLDPQTKGFADFKEVVSSRRLTRVAEVWLRKEKFLRIADQSPRPTMSLENSLKLKEAEIQERAANYLDALMHMRDVLKIPFVFEDD